MLALDCLRTGDEAELPEQVAPPAPAVAGAAPDERLELAGVERYPPRQVAHALELAARLRSGDDRIGVVLSHRLDVARPIRTAPSSQVQRARSGSRPAAAPRPRAAGRRGRATRAKKPIGCAFRSAQRTQPGSGGAARRTGRRQAERGRVRLRAEAGEGGELVVDAVAVSVVHLPRRALDEALRNASIASSLLPAHRAPQPASPIMKPASAIIEHLVLEDDDAVRLAERLAQQLVVDRRHVAGSTRSRSRASMFAGARPCPGSGRTSATCTVRSSRFAGFVRSRLCICARLSIWKSPIVSARWISAKWRGRRAGSERSIGSP